ncbi:MAG: treY [Glaciihabitans sp.]|jgi:(1->4)-alpha-D-glucan 1-alpha-D-glucosylmutase|nr:treY [Glaciihabitans sp.]
MPLPASTYRLQIRAKFDLDAAASVTDYLQALGVDWVYVSPLLEATTGSDHGYDVVDHSLVDPDRGGREGLDRLADAAHDRGMRLLIDIVPNHMGVSIPRENSWWWDLLEKGRGSRYADAFDVDWDFGEGKIRIPVLGRPLDEVLASDELSIVDGELRYFNNGYPLAAGSTDDGADLATVLSRQHYELMHWRREDAELNYRRFFAVSTLAGIRVEIPWVFEESHAEIVRWIKDGIADGLRVDHPDGLADPGGYLDSLAKATDGTEVWVEKILEGDERLPAFWATAGTTGYDALGDLDRVLVDPAGRTALDALDTRIRGRAQPVDWATLIHGTKRAIADGILQSEVLRLERDLPEREEGPIEGAADALAELLACFPVYRSYLPVGAEHLAVAARLAKQHRPELGAAIDALLPILNDPSQSAAIRFQQTSGMVMAKGVEDTAFYRYSRLSSLTEVGADPAEFSIDVAEFHRRQIVRQASYPASLTTLSTHDTKRGEDTRARITVLAEIPERWETTLNELRERAPLGDGVLENLLWESIVGAWPANRERLHSYAEKAAREAGSSTGWTRPNEDFEQRLHALIDSAFDNSEVVEILNGFVDSISAAGWSNSLTAKLIQLSAPGIPDVYQGSELWETSLVDPDNRRPIDFDLRRLYLAAIEAGAHPAVDATGAAKLLVTTRALHLRRDHPELFTRYAPLPTLGSAARHAVAFDRGGAIAVGTRLPLGLAAGGGWGESVVVLPGHPVVDVIADRVFDGGPQPLAHVLESYPVALLAPVPQ